MTRAVVAVVLGCTAGSAASAAPSLTIGARPTATVAFDGSVTIYGSLLGDGGARRVNFEARECGIYGSFHVVGGATTTAGGAFSGTLALAPGVTTSYRARSGDVVSNVVVVHVAPLLELTRSGRTFAVVVSGHGFLRGRRITLQRLAAARWLNVRTLTIRDAFGNGGSARAKAWLPARTVVRALLPRSQAKPCFLPAVSNTVRT